MRVEDAFKSFNVEFLERHVSADHPRGVRADISLGDDHKNIMEGDQNDFLFAPFFPYALIFCKCSQ